MDSYFKNRGKGGKKKVEAAAAEEQLQREEGDSHAKDAARRAIFVFGAGLNKPTSGESLPPDQQAGPSRAHPLGSEVGGQERALLSPVRKRSRAAGPGTGTEAHLSRFRGPELQETRPWLSDAEYHLRKGRSALAQLGKIYFPKHGELWKGGPLHMYDKARAPYYAVEQSFQTLREELREMEEREAIQKEWEASQKDRVPQLVKELAQVRAELLRTKMALAGSQPLPAPPPEGYPAAQTSASKGAQREEWVVVGRGGKKKKGARMAADPRVQLLKGVVNPPPGAGVAAGTRQGGNAWRVAPKRQGGVAVSSDAPRRQGAVDGQRQQPKKGGKPKLPRNPAVLLTAVGERSYASLLKEAREKVDLADLGIEIGAPGGGLHIKRARNGGYLFEIPGKGGADKADRFARELEDVLVGGAKVARPVKTAEVRVTGLVDGVTPDEVVAALAQCGKCPKEALAVGVIRRSPGGLGAVWIRCPLAVALAAVDAGGLRLGWTLARVQILEERPLQCYRCLKFGHLAAACTGQEDRKGRCFKCGGADHIAKECSADPRCLLCDTAGRDPGHRMGGRACPAAQQAWAKKGGRKVVARPQTTRGRSGGGKARKGRSATTSEGGAVGPGTVFRVPEHPAPRAGRVEGGAKTRAPEKALVRAEVPPKEAGGAEVLPKEAGGAEDDVDIDDIPCSQVPSAQEVARMDVAEEEEEGEPCLSLLLGECGPGGWPTSRALEEFEK